MSKERLEEIKMKFNNSSDVMLYVPSTDMQFLIEQAERVKKLREKDSTYYNVLITKVREQNERHRRVLKNIYKLTKYKQYDNTLEQIVSEIEKALEGEE